MKRFLSQRLGGLAILGAMGAIVACSHDNSSIFVQDVLAPQLVSPGTVCVFTAQTTQTTLSAGLKDLAFGFDYTPTYLVGNQLVSVVNSQQLMTETSIVNIQGAVVRVTDAAGNQLNTFTRLAAGTIYPSVGGVPGYAPISVTTIDQNTVLADPQITSQILQQPFTQRARIRLVTFVRFFGQTLGGQNVESGEFEFPVDICEGCLIDFTGQVNQACPSTPNCDVAVKASMSGSSSSSTTTQVPCAFGQEFSVSCTQCLGNPQCNPFPSGC
jgi:hypothetical protein